MALERQYVIPLRREWLKVPRHKRAKKAVRAAKEFLAKHMKTDVENVKVGRWLNQEIFKRGMKNPPGKVKIKAVKDDKNIVRAELLELSEKAKKIEAKEKAKEEKFKKVKEEKKKVEEAKKEEEKKAGEVIKETEEEKEKEEEEKIMHKEIPEAKKIAPEHKPAKATKPFRQSLKK